jgi:carbonic anhydrase/acetyltransferase-like protein (isoleucine patch superfamily)
MIRSFGKHRPKIAPSAYVDPQAVVIGDVTLGEDSSVWPCAVLRGDCHSIRVGACSSIQDGCLLHVQSGQHALTVGDRVTVGHGAILHGCTIESDCLIGMGSIVLNGARIGAGTMVAAGTLIPERAEIPPGSLVMGVPGKIRRTVSDPEREQIARSAEHYVGFKNAFRAQIAESDDPA